jgi:para-aminobenzoate synthetase component I
MWSDRQPVKLEFPCPAGSSLTYRDGLAVIRAARKTVEVRGRGFDILEAFYKACGRARLHGFLGYDLAAELEDIGALPGDDSRFPQMYFVVGEPRADARGSWVPKTTQVSTNLGREQFEAAVARIVATIHAGDIFQTNLCRCIEAPLAPGTEFDLYERLREINPARYENFLRIDESRTLFSVSPELFLKVERGVVTSEPIKGTRKRGATPEEDEALIRELRCSVKDRAELAMIVDVVRNDLSRVCQVGSVKVTAHAQLMTLPTVHHSYSTVQGRLKAGAGPIDLLRAAFPAASISGAPKIEAMRVAMREEKRRRGPCMGAIGWIDGNGDMEFSVAIRTAFTENGRVYYYAGCGITADSNPSDEFEESGHKAAAFLRALS